MSIRNSMTPSGIELATFRFVAQHLTHCATTVQAMYENNLFNLLLVFMITAFDTKLIKQWTSVHKIFPDDATSYWHSGLFRMRMEDLMSLMMDFNYVTVPSNMAGWFHSWCFSQYTVSAGFISFGVTYPKTRQTFSFEINNYQWISV
jgi:hypothetical protein